MITTRGFSIKRTEVDVVQEPVTLDELKAHLVIDFEDHDTFLNSLIKSARGSVETYLGVSLVETDIKARWETLTTQELPYGPVREVTSVKNNDGEVIADHDIEGIEFMSIRADSETPVIVEYTAGYEDVPEGIKLAIIKLVTDNFEYRTSINIAGNTVLPNDWKATCRPYSRKSWLA